MHKQSSEWKIALLQGLPGLVDLIVISVRPELSWIWLINPNSFVYEDCCLFELDFHLLMFVRSSNPSSQQWTRLPE